MLQANTDPKSIKNRCEKGSNFEGLLEGHTFGKSSMLEANMEASWHQNRCRNRCYLRKALFWKNLVFPQWKVRFFEIQGVQVGSKNRWKIDVKNNAETERLGNTILIDFWSIWEPSWVSKTEPRRSKIDVEMATKFDEFWKASWNTTFSAQEAPRRENAADRRRRWSRPEPTGGGFRRESRTFRLQEGLLSGTWLWKDLESSKKTWREWSHTPSRVGRRIGTAAHPFGRPGSSEVWCFLLPSWLGFSFSAFSWASSQLFLATWPKTWPRKAHPPAEATESTLGRLKILLQTCEDRPQDPQNQSPNGPRRCWQARSHFEPLLGSYSGVFGSSSQYPVSIAYVFLYMFIWFSIYGSA